MTRKYFLFLIRGAPTQNLSLERIQLYTYTLGYDHILSTFPFTSVRPFKTVYSVICVCVCVVTTRVNFACFPSSSMDQRRDPMDSLLMMRPRINSLLLPQRHPCR